jgi:hypothetical protein
MDPGNFFSLLNVAHGVAFVFFVCDRATFYPGITGAFGCTFEFQKFSVAQLASINGVVWI